MKRSAAGGIAWSWLATRYQDGMVLQAGTPEGWLRVASAAGRWVAAITAAVTWEQSAQNASWKTAGLMWASSPVVPSGRGNGRRMRWDGEGLQPGNFGRMPAGAAPA